MKIRQNVKHFAFKQALTAPVLGNAARGKLVDMHTDIFLEKADTEKREGRREHLDDFFDATMDAYVAALDYYPEAKAREITHVQANFDFYNHGWTEMMEFPSDELDKHHDRYAEFFDDHDITIDDPLGEFEPDDGVAPAPSTPAKLDDPEHPYAEGGFADDVYVETADGDVVVGGRDEPDDIDPEEYVADD
jgi:PAS domain-containing protein